MGGESRKAVGKSGRREQTVDKEKENQAAEMGKKSEGARGRTPAQVRLAWRGEISQPGPCSRPHRQSPGQREILTKQQNSFSILDLNYSPFPSAVSARTLRAGAR